MDCFWTDLVSVEQRCPTSPDVVVLASWINQPYDNPSFFIPLLRDKYTYDGFPLAEGNIVLPNSATIVAASVHEYLSMSPWGCPSASAWSLPDGGLSHTPWPEPLSIVATGWEVAPVEGIDIEGVPASYLPSFNFSICYGCIPGYQEGWPFTVDYLDIINVIVSSGVPNDGYYDAYCVKFVVETDIGTFDFWTYPNYCY